MLYFTQKKNNFYENICNPYPCESEKLTIIFFLSQETSLSVFLHGIPCKFIKYPVKDCNKLKYRKMISPHHCFLLSIVISIQKRNKS